MKILITGAAGQLGQALRLELEPRHEVLTTDLEDLDVRDLSALRAYVSAERPDVILHLAALTQVDVCEQRPEAAFEVNTLGTRYVTLAAREVGAELVVLSSDYVFNGRTSSPYREYDNPDPINVYGRSKLGGERAVTSLLAAHYVGSRARAGAHGGFRQLRDLPRRLGRGDELVRVRPGDPEGGRRESGRGRTHRQRRARPTRCQAVLQRARHAQL
jgi:dTDP-4-dehydrorhamnose reductase